MKVIIHDLSDEITYTLEKSHEDSVVIHANNQYSPCQGCFQCWLKNAGFCIMKDSLQHIGALVGLTRRRSFIFAAESIIKSSLSVTG